MVERFIWQSGYKRRKLHLAAFDRLGHFAGALCDIRLPFDRSCNVPFGRKTCKRCLKIEQSFD